MDDFISRQAAIDAIANCTNCGDEKTLRAYVAKHNLDNEWSGGVLEAINAVEDLPSAQPEIIRCKDCKHWDGVDTCDVIDAPVWGSDFCSMAERRSNE